MFRKHLISTVCIAMVLTSSTQLGARAIATGMLNYEQIRNYINMLVDTLVSDGGSVENATARREIIGHVCGDVTRPQSFGELFGTPIVRQDSYVEKQVIDGIREYSVRTAYSIAFSRIHNAAIAYRIKNRIEQEMRNLYAHASTLTNGIFAPFVGQSLREKVYQLCNQFDTPYQQPAPKIYPSNSCCICMNDFDANTMRVFLKPCGHDICTHCAQDYFITRHNNQCPHCRQTVDVHALRNILPSAPSF